MKKERQDILKKLIHEPILTFNKLWDKSILSNKFAYHLKVLEEDDLVEKTDTGYQLTHTGKKFATYIEGETGQVAKHPLIGVFICIVDETNNKVLVFKRTKEPFYGYWGVHDGKLSFDQYILECAAKEVKEET